MEGYGPASYGDAIADIYDQWYGDLSETEDAVSALAALAHRAGAARLLELGIGSGRLALPLAARGFELWGIDTSQAMVELLRSKPGGRDIPVAIGDMAALDLSAISGGEEPLFGLAFVAINTFFNLTTADAQQDCLRRVHDLLHPGGLFVLEAFVPAVDTPTNLVEARTVALDHVILTATRHDPIEQTVTSQYIELRESGIRLRPLVIRYAPVAELDAMAATAGLQLVERWSDWKGTPFTESANVHVSLYERTSR
jgi:SAM-dependent methyltransferase